MEKPWTKIVLSTQQAVIIASLILALGKTMNDISVMKANLEYTSGRVDRRVNPLEEKIEVLEDRITKLETCK